MESKTIKSYSKKVNWVITVVVLLIAISLFPFAIGKPYAEVPIQYDLSLRLLFVAALIFTGHLAKVYPWAVNKIKIYENKIELSHNRRPVKIVYFTSDKKKGMINRFTGRIKGFDESGKSLSISLNPSDFGATKDFKEVFDILENKIGLKAKKK